MKYATVLILLAAVLAAAPAWAQYGLYGSPEMLAPPIGSTAPQYAYPSAPAQPSYSAAPSGFDTAVAAAPNRYVSPPPPRPVGALPSDRAPRLKSVGPAGPSLVDQMLQEADSLDGKPGYPSTSSCGDYGCGPGESCASGPVCCGPLWYAEAAWLIMGRDDPNTLWTSYETNNNANQLPSRTGAEWGHGGQITVGRRFCGGCWTLEGTYWALDPLEGSASVTHPSTVSTPLDFSDVVYADPLIPGLPVDLFDGADEHRVYRRDEFHNIEMNMVRDANFGAYSDPYCRRLDIDWLIGIRYLHFEEQWAFLSLRLGGSWANPAEVGHLEDYITNSLVGFQFGFDVDYQCHKNVRLFVRPKFGIYNNHINHTFLAFRGDGALFAPDPASGVPGAYPVRSSADSLSFLTEIDLGVEWQFAPRWSAFAGYRVIAATGIGLADNQIPPYVVDIPELAAIDRNGQLVLHGAFAGLAFRF